MGGDKEQLAGFAHSPTAAGSENLFTADATFFRHLLQDFIDSGFLSIAAMTAVPQHRFDEIAASKNPGVRKTTLLWTSGQGLCIPAGASNPPSTAQLLATTLMKPVRHEFTVAVHRGFSQG